ncbi:hypothetical protein [Methylobacterium soli]|uniref:Uncharacterized protein n=1 Tax=Methylobacterium soli TaxID=553447 RepID=A0A6L3TBS9_9HYPH|nr:hypothetical protein [Methylobacterium soli]KAB1081424.1 hypothetical protein F6X53_03715 [Methylobacterium soli]
MTSTDQPFEKLNVGRSDAAPGITKSRSGTTSNANPMVSPLREMCVGEFVERSNIGQVSVASFTISGDFGGAVLLTRMKKPGSLKERTGLFSDHRDDGTAPTGQRRADSASVD